ncbi:hypothetical protein ACFTXJ_12740 [Streptomyces zhihengii]|uniref:hypothetical protein n=1 Tax=Streptomyces zhihengii TaxID=1818004 RepID=UPI0036312DAA
MYVPAGTPVVEERHGGDGGTWGHPLNDMDARKDVAARQFDRASMLGFFEGPL